MGWWEDRFDYMEAALPIGYMLHKCSNWDAFCEEIGINPCLLNEGIADSDDTHLVKIGILREYNILR